jgi:hypothetical protein
MRANRQLKRNLVQQKDQLCIRHKHTIKNLRVRQSTRLSKNEDNVHQLQQLIVDMRDMMFEHAAEEDSRRRFTNKQAKEAVLNKKKQVERAEANMIKMREWKQKYGLLQDVLAKQRNKSEEYVEELTQWKATAESMRHQYEDAIHELTPSIIQKVWVQNIEKRGESHFITSIFFALSILILTCLLLCSQL